MRADFELWIVLMRTYHFNLVFDTVRLIVSLLCIRCNYIRLSLQPQAAMHSNYSS